MSRTINTEIYSFSELNSEAQSKVVKDNYDINTLYNWSEFINDDFKKNKDFFDINEIYFSGFSSQGDGAMFEYDYINKDFIKSIIDGLKLPKWKIKLLNSCVISSGKGKQSGRYYHEKSVNHDINIESNYTYSSYPNIADFIEIHSYEIIEQIKNKYEELCKELYKTLSTEYYYLTSDECIIDTIEDNDYEFTINGNKI